MTFYLRELEVFLEQWESMDPKELVVIEEIKGLLAMMGRKYVKRIVIYFTIKLSLQLPVLFFTFGY